jgi:hypothetical protein
MALRDDWWYAELNHIYNKWQKFITSCYIVGGRVAVAGTVNVSDTAVRLIDELGVAYGVKQVDGKPRVSSTPYLYDISEGNVPGHERFSAFGERDAVVVGGSDIWGGVATKIPIPADAGEQMEIVSTAAADDGAPVGTGARTVSIHYLNAAGIEQNETITMNGTTPVPLTEPNVRFINGLHIVTAGPNGVAAGNITVYKQGAPATVYDRIRVGGTVDLNTAKMIPAGKTFYMTQWTATATDDKNMAVRLQMTSRFGIIYPRIFMTRDSAYLQNSTYVREFSVPLKIPELTMIKCYTKPISADGYCSASWSGWIEDD